MHPHPFADLHAHLFMDEGMSWMASGSFFGPLKAKNWRTRFASSANVETLNESGLGLLVISLFAHPLLKFSCRKSIRRQIQLAHQFVEKNPEWVIATDPNEGRRLWRSGKRVLVLSLERASMVIENERDLKEFVDDGGIRIVTLLHMAEDKFGGTAFLPAYRRYLAPGPFGMLSNMGCACFDDKGYRINKNGLTQRGAEIAQAMIDRGVWLDLSHASDKAHSQLMPILEEAQQPALYTHAVLRDVLKAERGLSEQQVRDVHQTGGIIGLIPSEEMVRFAGMPGFVDQYNQVVNEVGSAATQIGSDFRGGIYHMGATEKTGTTLDQEGFWHIGQTPEFWKALRASGAKIPDNERIHAEYFFDRWEQAAQFSSRRASA